ncbi:GGDEF domain-containing protein [bacterium]|nr:GGDEF domain-containing protein [bacterium]
MVGSILFNIIQRWRLSKLCLVVFSRFYSLGYNFHPSILSRWVSFEKAISHNASEVGDIVTMSFGITTIIPDSSSNTDVFIIQADEALYKSKEAGRDRMTVRQT